MLGRIFCVLQKNFQKYAKIFGSKKHLLILVTEREKNHPLSRTRKEVNTLDNSFEAYKQHSFDCYCKRLLKNEMRAYYNEMKRRRKHEVSFSELTAKELEQLSACDTYFADGQHVFNVLGNDILVRDETVAEALNSLPENKRDIILLSYFLDMTDGEIGEQLNLVRSTVQYRRTSILRELKKFMEEKGNE